MKINFSLNKGSKADKSQTKVVLVVGICTVVTIFSTVSAKSLLDQASYHRKELNAKNQVIKQLEDNIKTASTLQLQYQTFNTINPNLIGGKNTNDPNAAPPDGDNARLVLDALPSKYDFPALISSVAKVFSGLSNPAIAGSDISATQSSEPVAKPAPVEILLSVNGLTNYAGAQVLLKDLERSIRPFDVTTLEFSGTHSNITISIGMKTYFQPAKLLGSGEVKEVK